MNSLIKKLSLQWDLWTGQFRAFFPTGKEDLQACFQLITENGMDSPDSLSDLDLDVLLAHPEEANTRFAACIDTKKGEIIACLCIHDANQFEHIPRKAQMYHFDHLDKDQLSKIAVLSHQTISNVYLKTTAFQILMSHCFIEILKAGGQASIMLCDPGHFSIYKRMGMRPFGTLQKTESGNYYIPMIFLPDQEYLSLIHSPVLPFMRGVDFESYQAICQWYYQLVRENTELQVGSAFYPENEAFFEAHQAITEELSDAGREAFLKNALVIKCREDEVLITENDGGKAFGYVRQGLVRVVIGSQTIVVLGQGDIFGEIAFILNSKRTAEVVAASPDTEVVLFSESAINQLKAERDRTIIWRNLSRVLAQRLVLTNKLLG